MNNFENIITQPINTQDLWIHNENELKELIIKLDNSPELYDFYLKKERELLKFFVIDAPMESLRNALHAKRNGIKPKIPSRKETIKLILKLLGIK